MDIEIKKIKRQQLKIIMLMSSILDLLPDNIDKSILIKKIKLFDEELIKNE
jgi:hypothetical protein